MGRHETTNAPEDHRVPLTAGTLFARVWRADTTPAKERSPIVLFHDSLGSVALWRAFPEQLVRATGRTVIAYDRLGFGESSAHPGALATDFVDDESRTALPALLAALGVDRFVAFGHSVGGGMAIHVARAFPERCVAVVTESAQAFVEDRTLAGIRDAKQGFQQPEQLARLARYHGDKARWVVDAWTETWLSAAFADWSLATVLPDVRCPVLAIHGELDEYGTARHPESIASLVRGPSRSVILEGVHHVPHREVEARVLALVAEFLAPIA